MTGTPATATTADFHALEFYAEQWTTITVEMEAARDYPNAYTDVDVLVTFENETKQKLLRPAYWDGGRRWCVRFAPPRAGEVWHFSTSCSDSSDTGLAGKRGHVHVKAYSGENLLLKHGLLRMSEKRRSVIHADGTPFLMVADTPWALPFRGTRESVLAYAKNRQERGFNAALLMSVQPDQRAVGPEDRSAPGGFGVGFADLKDGHLNKPNISYFRQLDELIGILVDHGIVPIFNPVFQGFGWKGEGALGARAEPSEYVRFVRYLIARYGAGPAMWLVSADGTGKEAVVEPAGLEIENSDAYCQPTGIHYSPFDDGPANWTDDPKFGFHGNQSYQKAEWLDFQWAQTGHNGQHLQQKLIRMRENQPIKAMANGEPTYEAMGEPTRATGWWQGHEAWMNLVSGGTMGVVYGAGGLWNWKIAPDEPGWPEWADSQASWSDAIKFEGSRFVGLIGKAFCGYDFTDMQAHPNPCGPGTMLSVPGRFYLIYLPVGGTVQLDGIPTDLPWRWFNPMTGQFSDEVTLSTEARSFSAPDSNPWVLILGHQIPLHS